MLDDTPAFVGGGAEHSPEVLRNLIYASTSGSEGITEAKDLRVSQLSTPGNKVRVLVGSGLILNRYPGGGQQTYSFRNLSETQISVAATGSASGRTDLVVARILDPQYEGQPPANPTTFQYVRLEVIQGVSANITSFTSLGLNYPAIPLARITIPASTATITNAMITDLREVANPRTSSQIEARPTVAGDDIGTRLELNSRTAYPSGEWFPNVSEQTGSGVYYVDIPKWATRMQITMEWLSVRLEAKAGWGLVWVSYGPSAGSATPLYYTQAFQWDASEANTYRGAFKVAQEVAVPAAWRGTTQAFVGRGNKLNSATGYAGKVELTGTSGMILNVRFLEIADLD